MLNIAVGLTFSGGFIDLFLFGILQGNAKTSWIRIIPVGIIYFFLYYIIFRTLILKLNLKTPGREDDDAETKLYTKADYKAKVDGNDADSENEMTPEDQKSALITRGLGGKKNISDVDCCATRLRITVIDPDKVNDALLKSTGASGVVHKGQGVQIIYGPRVTVIKSDLEDYLASVTEEHFEDDAVENNTADASKTKDSNTSSDKAQDSDVESEPTSTVIISSPMTGIAADLSTAPDEAFASKMMGDGAVVTPEEGVVVAPEDGTVLFVFDTKHALGFTTDSGIGMIIHVGIDTVKLEGKGFDVQVEAGCHVNKGDVLMKLDLDYLKANAPSVTTPVICTELKDNQKIRLITDGPIKAGEPLYAVDTYEK